MTTEELVQLATTLKVIDGLFGGGGGLDYGLAAFFGVAILAVLGVAAYVLSVSKAHTNTQIRLDQIEDDLKSGGSKTGRV